MQIEKLIWTHEDFEIMGWHDNRIYAHGFEPMAYELFFDIDYIFKWEEPDKEMGTINFGSHPAL